MDYEYEQSPLSKGILSWWSDSYGECPRMFYHAFAAMPEWVPPDENHILYSHAILKNVSQQSQKVEYTATDKKGIEYLHLSFKPAKVTINGNKISLVTNSKDEGYTLKDLENGDYAVTINRLTAGRVVVAVSLNQIHQQEFTLATIVPRQETEEIQYLLNNINQQHCDEKNFSSNNSISLPIFFS